MRIEQPQSVLKERPFSYSSTRHRSASKPNAFVNAPTSSFHGPAFDETVLPKESPPSSWRNSHWFRLTSSSVRQFVVLLWTLDSLGLFAGWFSEIHFSVTLSPQLHHNLSGLAGHERF